MHGGVAEGVCDEGKVVEVPLQGLPGRRGTRRRHHCCRWDLFRQNVREFLDDCPGEVVWLWWCACGGLVVVVCFGWCGCGGVVVVVWL